MIQLQVAYTSTYIENKVGLKKVGLNPEKKNDLHPHRF